MNMKIILTGAAGFIGFHTCKRLLNENFNLVFALVFDRGSLGMQDQRTRRRARLRTVRAACHHQLDRCPPQCRAFAAADVESSLSFQRATAAALGDQPVGRRRRDAPARRRDPRPHLLQAPSEA